MFLTKFASSVKIIHRRDSFRASPIMAQRALSHPKIEVVWNSVVEEILGEGSVTGVRLKDTVTAESREIPTDGVFMGIGHDPNTSLLVGQLDLDPDGYVIVDEPGTATSVHGVFAAGDVADTTYKQAVTAAGMGCKAAMDAERLLEDENHGSPEAGNH
jgi:thioredoxin reductase (NADPH)